jgi:hypothetical protein
VIESERIRMGREHQLFLSLTPLRGEGEETPRDIAWLLVWLHVFLNPNAEVER